MQEITWQFELQTLPDVLARGQHVLVLLVKPDGKMVLGQKNLYPQYIFRMVGGGMEADEIPTFSAAREVEEELGIKIDETRLFSLAKVTMLIKVVPTQQELVFVTYLYQYNLQDEVLSPSSDLDGLEVMSEAEVKALVDRYYHLSTDLDPELHFAWADYGKVYGKMHELALELRQK